MQLVDIHCHLDFDAFEADRDEVVQRACEAGVAAIVANGTDPARNRRVVELARRYEVVKPALGIYPTHIVEMDDGAFDAELAWIEQQHPHALGEVGLDYKEVEDEHARKLMRERFVRIIGVAQRLGTPLIVHSRKAELACVELLEQHRATRVVMHCFSARKHLVRRVIENGWYLSIPCTVVRAEHFQTIAHESPLTQLLTETDAPYLSPFRERRNEPAFIAESIRTIAKLRAMDEEDVARAIWENYIRLTR